VERAVARLIDEAALDKGAFDGRSARSLSRVGRQLGQWNKDGRHSAVVQRLRARLEPVCGKLDGGDAARAACQGTFKAPAKTSA